MIKRFCLAAAAAAALAFGAFPAAAQAPIGFADASTLSVDAVSVDIRPSAPSTEYPQVGHRSPVTFEEALNAWAKAHFVLTGNSVNTFRITMRQGTIVEKLLPIKRGIAGWFKKEQATEYEGNLEVEVAVVDPNGQILGTTSGKAKLTRTMPEGSTDEKKQVVWGEMVKEAFDNLDKELLPNIRQYMGAYVH